MSPEIVMCVTGRFQRLNPLLADTCVGTAENWGQPPRLSGRAKLASRAPARDWRRDAGAPKNHP
ncbi:MAG TPA: hypothetical protein VL155_12360 [Terriglobales bacterium]|jgi:hypothetical protein|nr:hypothetical protein [Terriglobales bacterium]